MLRVASTGSSLRIRAKRDDLSANAARKVLFSQSLNSGVDGVVIDEDHGVTPVWLGECDLLREREMSEMRIDELFQSFFCTRWIQFFRTSRKDIYPNVWKHPGFNGFLQCQAR